MKGLGLKVVLSVRPVTSKGLGRMDVSHRSRLGYVADVTGMALAIGPSCKKKDFWGEIESTSQRGARASAPTGLLT